MQVYEAWYMSQVYFDMPVHVGTQRGYKECMPFHNARLNVRS